MAEGVQAIPLKSVKDAPKGFPLRGSWMAEGQTDEVAPSAAGSNPAKTKSRLNHPRHATTPRLPKPRPSRADRLLRNSAIACAVLLGVLALGNIRQPWAEKASEGIEKALSMRIDLDDAIGELTFVRQLMPESALVFLNVSGGAALTPPVDGAISHPWSNLQPWMMFEAQDRPVSAAASGTVTAISPLSDGRWGLLIDHGEGEESVYAGLSECAVASGARVARGQQLGVCGDGLYFELRRDGESVDPTGALGL